MRTCKGLHSRATRLQGYRDRGRHQAGSPATAKAETGNADTAPPSVRQPPGAGRRSRLPVPAGASAAGHSWAAAMGPAEGRVHPSPVPPCAASHSRSPKECPCCAFFPLARIPGDVTVAFLGFRSRAPGRSLMPRVTDSAWSVTVRSLAWSQDGHYRVSIAAATGQETIDAYVTEVFTAGPAHPGALPGAGRRTEPDGSCVD